MTRWQELLEAWGLDERAEAWRFCAGLSDRLPRRPPPDPARADPDELAEEIRDLEERLRAADEDLDEAVVSARGAAAERVEEVAEGLGLPVEVVRALGQAAMGGTPIWPARIEALRGVLRAWAYPVGGG